MDPITSFKGQHEFLSNFHAHPITIDGITYPTAEHAFQAAKTHDRTAKLTIAAKTTPGAAKRAGGKRGILKDELFRTDWEAVKVQIMKDIIWLKFSDEGLRKALLATGDAPLVEGNIWNDTFWGVYRGKGLNRLGQILQETRTKLATT